MGEKPPKEVPDFISGHRIRMRDKLRQNGGESLSRQELLEVPGIGRNTADMSVLIRALFFRLVQEQVTREDVLSNWERF